MRCTRTLASLSVVVLLVLPCSSLAQPRPLFNGQNLDGWEVPTKNAGRFVLVNGVLQIRSKSEWLLTREAYDDFVLTFEARPVGPESVGGVLVRTLVLPKHRLAYEVQVANGNRASPVLVRHYDEEVVPAIEEPPAVLSADGEWHHYRVECVTDRIGVWRDGGEVLQTVGLPLDTGRIGLHAMRGVVELRRLEIWKVNLPASPFLRHRPVFQPSHVSTPRPLRMVKPQYTRLAMNLGVQGEVWLKCVVEADGGVEECVVTRRLFGQLDAEALRAAKQWRFTPGTRNGEPVAVQVTISMSFTLK